MKMKVHNTDDFRSIASDLLVIRNTSIYVKDQNKEGEFTLLCLHALGHSSEDYESIFNHGDLSNFRIIAVDFPGHGASPPGNQSISSAYFADLMEGLIEQLTLRNLIILGNSIGGAVALRLAHRLPNKILMLQLANPAGLDKRGFVSKLFLPFMVWFFKKGRSGDKNFAKWFSRYYQRVLTNPQAIGRRTEIIQNAYKIAPLLVEGWTSFQKKSEDLRSIASQIVCPVLVTWAMKDPIVSFRRNRAAICNIPRHQLLKYNIGHTPTLENPNEFIRDFITFIQTILSPF